MQEKVLAVHPPFAFLPVTSRHFKSWSAELSDPKENHNFENTTKMTNLSRSLLTCNHLTTKVLVFSVTLRPKYFLWRNNKVSWQLWNSFTAKRTRRCTTDPEKEQTTHFSCRRIATQTKRWWISTVNIPTFWYH